MQDDSHTENISGSHKRDERVTAFQGSRERGRSASDPLEVPARGWKDILLRVWKNIGKDRVIVVAAGVTFYSVLALFPAIAALVALYGLFADPTTITSHLDSIAGLVAGGAIEVIRDQITRVAAQGRTTLGLTFLAGLAASLWSANAGMKSLFDALNLVYNEREERSFIWLNIISLTFTVSAIVFAFVAMGVLVIVPIVLNFLGLGGATELVIKIARWPALLIVVTLALAFLYRYGPSRENPQWRWITWGSAVAAISWLVLSILFSWYAENFGNYNKTYGSLGAIIAFMFWIWLSIIVVLIGAELNAEPSTKLSGIRPPADQGPWARVARRWRTQSEQGRSDGGDEVSDDRKKRGAQDRSRINTSEGYESPRDREDASGRASAVRRQRF